MTADLAIETHQLRKRYHNKVAVANLSLSVARGSIFGFLGANGAGKSTSIKMLLGLTRPTSGEARLLGAPAGDRRTRARIGFLPEQFRFYEWLTAAELLRLHGRLAGMRAPALRRRVPQMLELVGLGPHRDRRIHNFSKGMMQRIGLAQALIHEPEIVFLDEPTSGLDPLGRRVVRDVIYAQRERGATVFLNSHLLSEVEATCDNVAFLRDGEVVASRALQDFHGEPSSLTVRLTRLTSQTLAELQRRGLSASVEGERLELTAVPGDAVPEVVRILVAGGADIHALTPRRASLEDLFMHLVGEDRGL